MFTSEVGAFSKAYGCIPPKDILGDGDWTTAEANTSEFISLKGSLTVAPLIGEAMGASPISILTGSLNECSCDF